MLAQQEILQQNQQQNFISKFFEPVLSNTQEYVRVNSVFDKNNVPVPRYERLYAVRDKMTIKQLRHNWFVNNFGNYPEDENSEENYNVMWDVNIPLYNYYTMRKVKKQIGIQAFNMDILIRIYPQWDCVYHKDCSSVKYKEYEQANFTQIQTPMKICISQNQKIYYYFYIKTQKGIKLDGLIKKVQTFIKQQNQLLIIDKEFKFKIQMKTKCLQEQDIEKLKCLYNLSIPYSQTDNIIQLTDEKYKYIQLRDICPPGEVLQIKIQNLQRFLKLKQNQNNQKDPLINIVYYQKCDMLETKSPVVQKIITKKYRQIKNIKVQTLLYENDVYDALFTSVSYTNQLENINLLVKPKEKFYKFQEIINQTQQNNLFFVVVPENLLYYKQLIALKYLDNQNYSIQNLMLKSLNNQKHQKKIQQKKILRENQRKKQIENLGGQNFLYPMLMYTSATALYKQLNSFLRKSSLSLIQSTKISIIGNGQNQWCYPFCQKFIKALLKLPNYQGTLLRGSIGVSYDYKQGEIIQWNSFTSLTKKISTALKFLKKKQQKSLPFLFEVQTFSGKDIHNYSCYKQQGQVLILPYTRFKVIEKLEIYPYKMGQENKNNKPIPFYRLLQIPVPKNIPGHIVVWIDKNVNQNFRIYNKIIVNNDRTDIDLIQLISNNHFKIWLNQFKHILLLQEVKIHFISNMNWNQPFQQQGLETLQIIRSFDKTTTLVYYTRDIQKTKEFLEQHWKQTGQQKDQNVQIVQSLNTLEKIFKDKFCKQYKKKQQ